MSVEVKKVPYYEATDMKYVLCQMIPCCYLFASPLIKAKVHLDCEGVFAPGQIAVALG